MTKKYHDKFLNEHYHASPQRLTVEDMMDHRNYQAFDVGITRANPTQFRSSYIKKFQGMIIRDRNKLTSLTVTDTTNVHLSSSIIVSPLNTIDEIFNLVAEMADRMIDQQMTEFYRQIGFIDND
jgi:hypothetical protein